MFSRKGGGGVAALLFRQINDRRDEKILLSSHRCPSQETMPGRQTSGTQPVTRSYSHPSLIADAQLTIVAAQYCLMLSYLGFEPCSLRLRRNQLQPQYVCSDHAMRQDRSSEWYGMIYDLKYMLHFRIEGNPVCLSLRRIRHPARRPKQAIRVFPEGGV